MAPCWESSWTSGYSLLGLCNCVYASLLHGNLIDCKLCNVSSTKPTSLVSIDLSSVGVGLGLQWSVWSTLVLPLTSQQSETNSLRCDFVSWAGGKNKPTARVVLVIRLLPAWHFNSSPGDCPTSMLVPETFGFIHIILQALINSTCSQELPNLANSYLSEVL